MPYRKINFEYDLNALYEKLKGADYSTYDLIRLDFLAQAREAGYKEQRLHVFWRRVRLKLKTLYGYEMPKSMEWKNLRMRIYREKGTTRI